MPYLSIKHQKQYPSGCQFVYNCERAKIKNCRLQISDTILISRPTVIKVSVSGESYSCSQHIPRVQQKNNGHAYVPEAFLGQQQCFSGN